ncbi:hypothetical protein [Streptomyces toxytricini]|uniref:hypothetical protein n=1 Tax=Streptomyces toxytricini TaxID=67369 RepID=UPI0034276ECA
MLVAQAEWGWLVVPVVLGGFVAGVPGLWVSCSAVARRRRPLSRIGKIKATVAIAMHGGVVLSLTTGIVAALMSSSGL